MEMRLFYSAILAGVLSLIFRRNGKVDVLVGIGLAGFITSVYILEVPVDDTFKTSRAFFDNRNSAVDTLIMMYPTDYHWYVWARIDCRKQLNSTREAKTRWLRKFNRATMPDPEQIVFYCLPMLAVYGLCVFRRR